MITEISNETRTISDHIMEMIRNGKIRKHQETQIPTEYSTGREENEIQNYKAFLISRNGYDVLNLTGHQ